MSAIDLPTATARLGEMIGEARAILPFTGAGISTECGIPDFRSPGGIWTKSQPIPFDEFLVSQEARNESWRRRFAMEDEFSRARPGRGHRAIATLYRAGKVPAVVTQNIDNLHQASGIAPEDVASLAAYCATLPHLKLRGLMTIPAPQSSFINQRQPFHQLFLLWQFLRNQYGSSVDTLSMGMSDDFEAAIAEGSTLVRLGRAIFPIIP